MDGENDPYEVCRGWGDAHDHTGPTAGWVRGVCPGGARTTAAWPQYGLPRVPATRAGASGHRGTDGEPSPRTRHPSGPAGRWPRGRRAARCADGHPPPRADVGRRAPWARRLPRGRSSPVGGCRRGLRPSSSGGFGARPPRSGGRGPPRSASRERRHPLPTSYSGTATSDSRNARRHTRVPRARRGRPLMNRGLPGRLPRCARRRTGRTRGPNPRSLPPRRPGLGGCRCRPETRRRRRRAP